MKKGIIRLAVFSLLLTLMLPFSAAAQSDVSDNEFLSEHQYEDYAITSYDINIDVSEYNVLSVSETINAYFFQPRHGIYRTIPITNTIKRTNGTESVISANIKDVSVPNDNHSTEITNGNYIIKIGDENSTVTGPHTYNISYTYDLGKDTVEGEDELYYNIIGTQWENAINNVTFTINMPKEFDAEKLGFSSGDYGNVGTNNIYYSVDGNTITGYYSTALEPGEALTVRLTLPDGYFKFDYTTYYIKIVVSALIPLAALIIVLILFIKYGRDKHVVPTVEFYPPDGMNSAEARLWYSGLANNEAVISLLVYLANKGYIKIENGRTKKDFVLHLVRNYDGSDVNESLFMQGLFKNRTTVTPSDLENHFYMYVNDIRANLNSRESRSRIYNPKSLTMKIISFIIIALCFFGGMFVLFSAVGVGLNFDSNMKIALVLIIAFTVAAIIIACFMLQRTEKGNEMMGRLMGFREFLETAEKEKLEALVEENPTYFYDILPYTYALGVSDKWMKKFETIAMEPPTWYSGNTMFNYIMFTSFMNNAMHSATNAMTSQPQNSGGFSGGGGGFSGGGAGGGGGGSW